MFAGWYLSDDSEYDFETAVTNGFTLYAKWNVKDPTTTYLEALGATTAKVVKLFKDGRIVIWKDGVYYDLQGNIIR